MEVHRLHEVDRAEEEAEEDEEEDILIESETIEDRVIEDQVIEDLAITRTMGTMGTAIRAGDLRCTAAIAVVVVEEEGLIEISRDRVTRVRVMAVRIEEEEGAAAAMTLEEEGVVAILPGEAVLRLVAGMGVLSEEVIEAAEEAEGVVAVAVDRSQLSPDEEDIMDHVMNRVPREAAVRQLLQREEATIRYRKGLDHRRVEELVLEALVAEEESQDCLIRRVVPGRRRKLLQSRERIRKRR